MAKGHLLTIACSLRRYDPDQVQRVRPKASQVFTTPQERHRLAQ